MEEGTLSIVKRERGDQVRYASNNPRAPDHPPYACPDEAVLVAVLHQLGAHRRQARRHRTPAMPRLERRKRTGRLGARREPWGPAGCGAQAQQPRQRPRCPSPAPAMEGQRSAKHGTCAISRTSEHFPRTSARDRKNTVRRAPAQRYSCCMSLCAAEHLSSGRPKPHRLPELSGSQVVTVACHPHALWRG